MLSYALIRTILVIFGVVASHNLYSKTSKNET